jgi:hypothetical protein
VVSRIPHPQRSWHLRPTSKAPGHCSARSAARQFSSFPSSRRQQTSFHRTRVGASRLNPPTAATPAAALVPHLSTCIEAQTLFPRRQTWRAANREPHPPLNWPWPKLRSQPHPRRGAFPPTSRPHVFLNLDPIHHQSTPSTADPGQDDRGVVYPPLSGQSAQKW